MLITGEGMADQHRVAALRVERAIGLIGDLKGGEIDAGIEPQRLLRPKRTSSERGLSASCARPAGSTSTLKTASAISTQTLKTAHPYGGQPASALAKRERGRA